MTTLADPAASRPRTARKPSATTHPSPSRPSPAGPAGRGRRAGGRPVDRRTATAASRPAHQDDRLRFTPGLATPGAPPRRTAADTAHGATRRAPARPSSGSPQATTAPASREGSDPVRSAGTIVLAAAEVLIGLRPVDHLTRWTTPALFEALSRRAGLAARILGPGPRGSRPRMRKVRAEPTLSGAYEATVLMEAGGRIRAAAARLEQVRGRWVLASLDIA